MFQEESTLRGGQVPATETTLPPTEWQRIEADAEFQQLVGAKRRFIVPATIFFIIYYFALPVLVGYFPGLMDRNVIGNINIAYLFALSQFFMAWILAALYVREAGIFDKMAAAIVARVKGGRR
ncbi:MAG TPA: DUF485 domain-containing protein [Anaerolineae bacterium]